MMRQMFGLFAAVMALAAGSAVAEAPVRQLLGVQTLTRDGVTLSSDVWLPQAPGKYPVILIRTPYVKTEPRFTDAEIGAWYARHGYAYVVQDVRGRGDSGGEFDFFFSEGKDGYDSIEAMAAQPWSNGRVCTMGVSYLGTVQWLAAREKPSHLVCMAPTSPAANIHNEIPSMGGAFMMFWALTWLNETSGHVSQNANAATIDWDAVFAHRPLATMDEAMGRKMRLYREFLQHDTLDDYWKRVALSPADYAAIDIPILVTTGLFDGDQEGALHTWKGMQARPGGAKDMYLTLGPWTHIQSYFGGAEKVGEIALSKDAAIDNKALHLAFFDRYLKQSTTTFDRPKVRVYVTGANVWRNFDAWPVPSATTTRLYFADDKALAWKVAPRSGADAYTYDPKNPVRLDLAFEMFAIDRRKVQERPDVLTYTTPVLDKPVQVIGPVAVELHAASDARDTDFTASIQDVQPDGRAVLIGSKPVGIVRARYRNRPSSPPSLLTPGKPELFRIELGAISHQFQPGHRIRVEISSSSSPMFNPNQNTGNPIATDTEWKIAHQQILRGKAQPSALVLPIVQ
jgi:putative CocE/NonD family hydrolase